MRLPSALPRTLASTPVFWWACALSAPPIAFAAAAAGLGMATPDPPRDIATIALWSIAEEIVFRGALQPALAHAFARRFPVALLTPANLVTSIVFAAFHLWRHSIAAALAVFPVSIVFGRARELSGRVWPAAVLHVVFNLLLYAASALLASVR